MTRFRTVLLLSALLALATGLAACGGGDSEADAQEVVESATLEGIESGEFDLMVEIGSSGEQSGDLKLDVSGPFRAGGDGELPQLAVEVSAKGELEGENVDFEGGLTLLSDRAFVNFEGTEYEVDPTTFGFVKSGLEQAQQSPESSADVTACQDAATGLDLALIEDPQNEGSADVDGQETTKISGELDLAAAIDAVIALTEDPACGAQLESAGPLPLDQLDEAKQEVTKAVKKAQVELYVGEDGIVRRLVADLVVAPGDDGGEVRVAVDLTLSNVNGEPEISEPSGAQPLEDLFKQLGVNPLELLEGSGGITGALEGLIEPDSSGGNGGGGSGGGGSSDGSSSGGGVDLGDQQAYLECLQEVETASDLQDCASLAP